MASLTDPPKPEAIQAVATSQKAGIEVKMITGDHKDDTAMAIAQEIGLKRAHQAVEGKRH